MDLQERYAGAIMGHVIADALGTAYTMKEPCDIPLKLEMTESTDAVTGHKVAKGQLSDDGSQLICLGESLIANGFDVADQFLRYQRWLRHGYATPLGQAIGYGNRTVKLLNSEATLDRRRMRMDEPAVRGTGGLMRVLAIPLYLRLRIRMRIRRSLFAIVVRAGAVVTRSLISGFPLLQTFITNSGMEGKYLLKRPPCKRKKLLCHLLW
jgi:ADP-ribosylglycohydrolase